jgi:hypothetical protein
MEFPFPYIADMRKEKEGLALKRESSSFILYPAVLCGSAAGYGACAAATRRSPANKKAGREHFLFLPGLVWVVFSFIPLP